MGKKKTIGIILILLTLCLFTGCLFSLPTDHLGKIEGDITCDFRAGRNATHMKETVKTDAVFDKDRFVELYNEDAKYDPAFYKHHTDRLDLRINADEEREKFEEIAASEVNFRVYFNEQNRHVSLFRYDSKLYFFIMSMGGRSKPDEKGYYYQEVPEKMADYWNPIYDKVMADKEADRKQMYGSFNVEEAMSYDKKFTAKVLIGSGMVTVQIIDNETDAIVSSFKPCGKGEFYGICWENDSYNLWVQTDTSLVICYSMKESKWDWQINENARKPDYIKGRYD